MLVEVWRSHLEIELKMFMFFTEHMLIFKMKVILNLFVVQFPHLLNGSNNGLILMGLKKQSHCVKLYMVDTW